MLLVATVALGTSVQVSFARQGASNPVVLRANPGGLIATYDANFMRVAANGRRVVLDGECLSACTLALARVPRSRICATNSAVLGFHAGSKLDKASSGAIIKVPSQEITNKLMQVYPSDIQQWIYRNGGLTTSMIYMRVPEIFSYVQKCSQ